MPTPTRPDRAGSSFRKSLQRLYAIGTCTLGLVTLLKRLNRPHAVILTYHAFSPDGRGGVEYSLPALVMPVVAFAAHLRYLERHYTVVQLSQMVDWLATGRPLPERTAVLTLDDGYMSSYSLALPLLRRHRMPATVFLATDFVDRAKPFWWDLVVYLLWVTLRPRLEIDLDGVRQVFSLGTARRRAVTAQAVVGRLVRAPETARAAFVDRLAEALDVDPGGFPAHESGLQPLTWTAIREMAREEIEFGSHTVTHTVLTSCGVERQEWELVESRRIIERQLCQPCELFCYPNGRTGDWDARTEAVVRKAGYRCAVTGIQGLVQAGDNAYALHRIPASANPFIFRTTVSGANPSALMATFRSLRAPSQR